MRPPDQRTRSPRSPRRDPNRRLHQHRRRQHRRPPPDCLRRSPVGDSGGTSHRAAARRRCLAATSRHRGTGRRGRPRPHRPPRARAPPWKGGAASTARGCSRGSRFHRARRPRRADC